MLPEKISKIKRRLPKVGLRLAILLGGAITFSIYTYFNGQLQEDKNVFHHEEGGIEFDLYSSYFQRQLSNHTTNSTKPYNECMDPDTQPAICLGYGADTCKRLEDDQMYILLFICLALLYLFVGIAIVCDELFVPALEIIAEKLELSNDVAGATLMAAGGSAPELATSFVGTFKRTDVGFGTIVGSAVFNVLFVIAMCVMFTPEEKSPLQLTWWPLFRDCSYYTLTLAFLAGFMSDSEIHWWEALIQFMLYWGYVAIMSRSAKIEQYIVQVMNYRSILPQKDEVHDFEVDQKPPQAIEAGTDVPAPSSPVAERRAPAEPPQDEMDGDANFNRKAHTFRAGILQLLTKKGSLNETAGIAFVSRIEGDVDQVFQKIDLDNNGSLSPDEIKEALVALGTPEDEVSDQSLQAFLKEMDPKGQGHVTKAAFTLWYTNNEDQLKNHCRSIFEKYDTGKAGIISREDVATFMQELQGNKKTTIDEEEIYKAAQQIESSHEADVKFLNYKDFSKWYEKSMFWEKKDQGEEEEEAQESMFQSLIGGFMSLVDPEVGLSEKAAFVICAPLTAVCCLIPDCRPEGREGWAFATLIGSIIMIAIFAIFMVELAEIFGASLGIPDVAMGLTILAAGTSVPDLLSSVIVAKQGYGDMTVSSSIGSNIFDVTVGLPLPWLVYSLVAISNNCNCIIQVESDGLFISLVILLCMVAAVVTIIHWSNWRMTKTLGYSMLFLYVIYLVVALSITPEKEYSLESCSPFKPLG